MWRTLKEMDIPCAIIHSFLTQKRRLKSLYQFKNQKVSILLATDVIGRGIDIKAVDLVINYDLPYDHRNFVHRVGRAARGGKAGLSVSLITQFDLERVKRIEEGIDEKMEEEDEVEEEDALEHMNKIITCKKRAELEMGSKGEVEKFQMLRKRKNEFKEMVQTGRANKRLKVFDEEDGK